MVPNKARNEEGRVIRRHTLIKKEEVPWIPQTNLVLFFFQLQKEKIDGMGK